MKRLLFIVVLASLISCSHDKETVKTDKVSYDTVALKKKVSNIYDSMHMEFKAKKFNNMLSYLADDGSYYGTDPSEVWTKHQLSDFLLNSLTDTVKTTYTVSDRKILPADDGKSAVVVEQFFMPGMSTKMEVRSVSRAAFRNDRWLIDVYSWNFIPKNGDISKLNQALGK